jgi:hypothetical protein
MKFLSVFSPWLLSLFYPPPTSQLPNGRFLALPQTTALTSCTLPPTTRNIQLLVCLCVSTSCLYSPPVRHVFPNGLQFFWLSHVCACDTAVNIWCYNLILGKYVLIILGSWFRVSKTSTSTTNWYLNRTPPTQTPSYN